MTVIQMNFNNVYNMLGNHNEQFYWKNVSDVQQQYKNNLRRYNINDFLTDLSQWASI